MHQIRFLVSVRYSVYLFYSFDFLSVCVLEIEFDA